MRPDSCVPARVTACASVLPLLLAASLARAAGAEVPFISISSLGTANANAAEAGDASVQYFNPAGLALMKGGTQVSQPLGLVFGGGRVYNDTSNNGGTKSVQSYGSPDGTEDGRAIGSDPGVLSSSRFLPKVLPLGALFVSSPYDDRVTLGLGVFSPGGGNLNYKGDWFGRYFLKLGAIETININPSLAIRFDDRHSIGLGVSVLGGHAILNQKVDVQGVKPYLTNPIIAGANATQLAGLGGVLNTLGVGSLLQNVQVGLVTGILPNGVRGPVNDLVSNVLISGSSTASVETQMMGMGYGYNLGYLFNFSEDQRIGVSFRSKSVLHLRGDFEWDLRNVKTNTSALDGVLFSGPFNQYLAQNYRPNTQSKLDLIIPAKLDIAYFQRLTPKVDIMANLQFNQTSAIQSQCIVLADQPGGPSGTVQQGQKCIQLNWRDTYTASVGMNYHVDSKVTLRTGVQYDQTPVPSAQYRNPTLPDNNRLMLALGGNYQHDKQTSVDLAYAYLRIQDGGADYHDSCRVTYETGSASTANNCTSNGGIFRGDYRGVHAHIIGMQLNKKF